MTPGILAASDENHLEIASGTYESVDMPEVKVKIENPGPNGAGAAPELISQSRRQALPICGC